MPSLLEPVLQTGLAGLASSAMAVLGIVLALVFLHRRWSVCLLAIGGCLLVLASNLLAVVNAPIGLLLVGLAEGGRMTSDQLQLATNGYRAATSLVSAAGMALLVASAVAAVRGVRPDRASALASHQQRERFLVGIAYTAAGSVVAALLVAGLLGVNLAHGLAAGPEPTPTPKCTSSGPPPARGEVKDPGTYRAGKLHAPDALLHRCLSPTTTADDVSKARKARDDFSQATGGGPAIYASYGFLIDGLELSAAQGYISADDYFAGSQVKYEKFGQVTCGTLGASICIRSDQAQQLTIVVGGFPDKKGGGATIAQAVDEAWKAEGGH